MGFVVSAVGPLKVPEMSRVDYRHYNACRLLERDRSRECWAGPSLAKVSSARFNLMGCVKPAASPVGERGPSLVETVDVPPHARRSTPSVPSERNPLPRGVVPGSTPRCHWALAPAMDGPGC